MNLSASRLFPGVACASLAAGLLAVVQIVVERPMLLAERFFPGIGGWVQIAMLALYAGVICIAMMDPDRAPTWRVRIWKLFSVVFFAQFVFGVLGVDVLLMTGKLHIPVPAIILAGPVYRGGGLFMLMLLGVTVLLVGPAWCSHLCYIGAWDDAAARGRKRPGKMARWRPAMQIAMVPIVIGTSLVLNLAGVSGLISAIFGVCFGVVGVLVMLLWSRRTGVMTHCTAWCPVGVVATWAGKINPLRMRIGKQCNDCGLCTLACRYDALSKEHISRRKPGMSCTLCGDCVTRCKDGQMGYWLPGLSSKGARTVFIVMVVALHAVFLGVARL